MTSTRAGEGGGGGGGGGSGGQYVVVVVMQPVPDCGHGGGDTASTRRW